MFRPSAAFNVSGFSKVEDLPLNYDSLYLERDVINSVLILYFYSYVPYFLNVYPDYWF